MVRRDGSRCFRYGAGGSGIVRRFRPSSAGTNPGRTFGCGSGLLAEYPDNFLYGAFDLRVPGHVARRIEQSQRARPDRVPDSACLFRR